MDALIALTGNQNPQGTFVDGGAVGNISGTFPYPGVLVRDNDNSDGPKAYLNYLYFDRDFEYITGGFRRVSTNAKEAGQGTDEVEGEDHERLAFEENEITITQPGYVYIYLSNENETPVEVFFDDFKVEHVKSPVVQMDDYYPFGLTFNSFQRESSLGQKYLYNGKEKQDELNLNWYDYGARMLDPAIGRWLVVDNLADHPNQLSWTPYHYVKSNPTSSIDPDGNCGDCFLDLAFILYDVGEIAYDYVTTGKVDPVSVAALSADAVALATPVVTGAGVAVRLAKEGGEQVAKQITKEGVQKAAQLAKNRKVGQKAEDIVQKKLEGTLKEGQEILEKPKVVTANGKTTYPDKIVVDKNTKDVVNPTEVKSGDAKLSRGQQDLSNSGGTIKSNKYPEYNRSTIQPGQLNVERIKPTN